MKDKKNKPPAKPTLPIRSKSKKEEKLQQEIGKDPERAARMLKELLGIRDK